MDYTGQQNRKVYTRYCPGAIVTGLLSFAIVGMVCVFLFVPIFSFFNASGQRVPMTGLEYVLFSLRSVFPDVNYDPRLMEFDMYFKLYVGDDAIAKFLKDYHNILEMVVSAFILISAIFAFVAAIYGIIMLAAGRNRSPIMVSAMGSSSLSSMSLFIGLLFLYFFLCNKAIAVYRIPTRLRFDIMTFVYLGIFTGVVAALSIVYHFSFKRRVFAGTASSWEYNNLREMNLPIGLTQIGDNAFAMNTKLRNALIPEGISYLGQGAFSNCLYLESVTIPTSVTQIGANCFYNTPNLKGITYLGSIEQWQMIYKGSNWISLSGAAYIDTNNGRYMVDNY